MTTSALASPSVGIDAGELLAVLRLSSPMLPIGGFSYSQGLETAIDKGWVSTEADVSNWIASLLEACMGRFELPSLAQMLHLFATRDCDELMVANDLYLASRETSELRAETLQMGNSLIRLLQGLDAGKATLQTLPALRIEKTSLPLAWTLACSAWRISQTAAVHAYAWTWSENQVAAAIKALPLGQQAGQRLLQDLHPALLKAGAMACPGPDQLLQSHWSNFAPGFAIASSCHESQYSRIFRS